MHAFIENHFGKENIISIETMPQAGSDRTYTRVVTLNGSYVCCFNAHVKENIAFFYFAKHFSQFNIHVPKIVAINDAQNLYILEDLGNTNLLDKIQTEGESESVIKLYQQSLKALISMQIEAGESIDFEQCFAAKKFDIQMIKNDLNYFKYYFLDILQINYDKEALQNEFNLFCNSLNEIESEYFMFRDFQGRNIMIKNEEPYFIDFQGGMKGPLQYDVASLLWQAKANISQENKKELYEFYKSEVKKRIVIEDQKFDEIYGNIVLLRLLQVLGAYGFRGLIQKKTHFVSSIPFGLKNLSQWMEMFQLNQFPLLKDILMKISQPNFISQFEYPIANDSTKLKIDVQSFSYKILGIPNDDSGNGGGFVFDCRGILNPGRFEEYKKLTGRDQPVIDFLESKTKIAEFLQGVKQVIDISIQDYLNRGFEHLMISFGCTGGQHRSVYCADAIAKYLKEKYNLNVAAHHIQQEAKNWIN